MCPNIGLATDSLCEVFFRTGQTTPSTRSCCWTMPGPHEFPASDGKHGVDVHPHKGFETVTILYQGELEHRDSSGSHGAIGAGDVQWMTAASGIVHEEFHSRRFSKEGGTLEMIQLWVNLPAVAKKSPPKYQDLRDDTFPRVELADGGGLVRVIAGDFQGKRGPADTFTPINVWDFQLNAGGALDARVPEGHTSVLIVQNGELTVNDEAAQAVELFLFEREGESINLQAETQARVLVLTGEPLNEPIFGQGPFVMNTREEIHEAIREYQAGKMGSLS